MSLTAPDLLALANHSAIGGPLDCFLCGTRCTGEHQRKQFIGSTFTDWSIVAAPESDVICAGCELSLQEQVVMLGREKPQRMRNYSWILTRDSAIPLNKGELSQIRRWCLEPPEPPFALVFAVSGQKHILFRAPVNYSREIIAAQLETERIVYTPASLVERLRLTMRMTAAVGKPALSGTFGPSHGFRVAEYWSDGIALLNEWKQVAGEPLSRLALFLTPGMEVCRNDFPSNRTA